MAPLQPPVPPQLLGFCVHASSSCSEKTSSLPDAMATADSVVSAAENDQQPPQPPWSLTGVTTPFSRQSSDAGSADTGTDECSKMSSASSSRDMPTTEGFTRAGE